MKKVGIMGGTFDPIHNGHLMIAENAWKQFELDYVLIMPSGNPPHKMGREVTESDVRGEMTRIAISDNAHFKYSNLELERSGYIYTSDTLEILKKSYPDTEFYFIIGEDSIDYFEKWHEPQKIVELAQIIVAVRSREDNLEMKAAEKGKMFNCEFHLLETPFVDISSSDIRQRIKDGSSVRYMLPDNVIKFIEDNELYLG